MVRPKLTLYYDLHSPYTYLAYYYLRVRPKLPPPGNQNRRLTATQHSETFQNCDVTYVPVLMIGFVKAGLGSQPWEKPSKRKCHQSGRAGRR